jgi:hypothetical protein
VSPDHSSGAVGDLAQVVPPLAGVRRPGVPELEFEGGSRPADHCHDGRWLLVGDPELLGVATKFGAAFVEGPEPLLVRPDGVVAWSGNGDVASALTAGICHPIE